MYEQRKKDFVQFITLMRDDDKRECLNSRDPQIYDRIDQRRTYEPPSFHPAQCSSSRFTLGTIITHDVKSGWTLGKRRCQRTFERM
jgi:hypothetical protein